jgi:DNA-binding transcriptional regulator YdaS (Cro superfamily)
MKTVEDRNNFALSCKTSLSYLRKCISLNHPPGPKIAVSIERASRGKVHRKDMYPDDYWEFWPELK